MMRFLGIIPARYASTRLEGKPLIDIAGKPMIQWVYERAAEALQDVYVATDDARIEKAVNDFGGQAIMTSPEHSTGTNRCLEAFETIEEQTDDPFDVVINIQGDEPLLHPSQLQVLMDCFDVSDTEIATLVMPVTEVEDLFNESEAFVTVDKDLRALYFSRSVIPALKGRPKKEWIRHHTYYKHVGMYAFTPEALRQFAALPQSKLEVAEGLEQNRWLENGGRIRVALTEHQSIPVDTLDDLVRIRKIMGMF
jgi:3-deoxy-manno-octulosonate cytidylyltransferase (CMP-KDO synthetase)